MKILIFNQDWFAAELRELGHEVLTCGSNYHLDHKIELKTNHIDTVIAELNGFSPDIIIWHDNSMPTLLMSGLESCSVPVLFYSVDTFHHYSIHSYVAEFCDHIFVAQKDYLNLFAGTGTPASWLPLWAPRYVEASSEKRWPITFVGNLNAKLNPRRVQFFEALKQRIPIHIAHGNYWEHFPFSNIVVNQTVKGDLNFRVFEAMMCGSLLLTERTPNGLLDLFSEGEHLVAYTPDDIEEVSEKVTALLQSPALLQQIAHAGREEILKHHTPMSRAIAVNDVLKNVTKRPPAKDRYFRAMVNHATTNSFSLRHTSRHCPHALLSALVAAKNGLIHKETLSDTQAGNLVRTCFAYDAMTGTSGGADTLAAFSDYAPENSIIKLTTIRNLLNTGRRLEAEVIASTINPQAPTQVFQAAEKAIVELLSL